MRKPTYKLPFEFDNLKEMLEKSGKLYNDRPAYVFKTDKPGEFDVITHKEFRDDINALGTSLIELGLKNKRVAVISDNRYEWGVAYLAVVTGVGVVVPLDKALPDNEIASLIKRSGVEAIVYSNKYNDVMKKMKNDDTNNLEILISMDLEAEENGIYSQKELIKQGKERIEEGDTRFLNAKIDSQEMSIMLFTSGTTAMSKAVMLSHKNICSNLKDIVGVIKLTPEDRFLSFLPLHHTFECTVGFLYNAIQGCSTAFCEGIRHIADNIAEYKVTAMISVPILFEAMYKKVMKSIEKQGKIETLQKGIKISELLQKVKIDIRRQLFKEIHATLGGNLRLLVAGGAALDPDTERGFNQLGFTMYQGYGLTETSPVIAAEDDKFRRIGSIGKAFPSLDVKINEPNEEGIGELMVKGPSVMIGYYENEEATKETLEEDGWLHTGDLARIDSDGYIYIAGRKKYVIVLKNGKNIYPEEIEILVNQIEGVKESFVYGKPDKGDYKIAAKIVYDKEQMKEIYNVENEEEIKEIIWKQIKDMNKKMPTYKYIKEIIVTDKDLIKTTTQKIKRHEELKEIMK